VPGLALVEQHGGRVILQAGIRGILWTSAGAREVQLTAEHPVARTLAGSAAVEAAVAELLAVAGDPDDPTGMVAALACRWDDMRTEYLAMQLRRLRRLVPPSEEVR
jgi:predicted aminopeptidase